MRTPTSPLDAGDLFPDVSLTLLDGRSLTIPKNLKHPFNIVLFNRGHWCPFCNTQLKSFQQGLGKLTEAGIGVLSLSADSLENARKSAAENGVEFDVAWGVDPELLSKAVGTFYSLASAKMPAFVQSAGFVLGAGGRVLSATYSTGPIGRLAWQDALGFVQYVKSQG